MDSRNSTIHGNLLAYNLVAGISVQAGSLTIANFRYTTSHIQTLLIASSDLVIHDWQTNYIYKNGANSVTVNPSSYSPPSPTISSVTRIGGLYTIDVNVSSTAGKQKVVNS